MTGITPTQRTELLNAIDTLAKASREMMMAISDGKPAAPGSEKAHDAYRRVLALVDEATDYTRAEAVSEE